MKALKKLIPAAAMLLLCAAMMTTATFAWFNMNDKVAVDTGTTNVTAPTNLQIAAGATPAVTDYSNKFTNTANNPINPVTVARQASDAGLDWKTTNAATNAGTASGALTDLTLEAATGKESAADTAADAWYKGKYFYNSYVATLKNIGGTMIDVKIDTANVNVKAPAGVAADKDSADLLKAVCFMIIVGDDKVPTAVWSQTRNNMLATSATDATPSVLIKGTSEDDTDNTVADDYICTLTAQQAQKITIVAWLEGNSEFCANTKVEDASIAYTLDFSLTATAVTV